MYCHVLCCILVLVLRIIHTAVHSSTWKYTTVHDSTRMTLDKFFKCIDAPIVFSFVTLEFVCVDVFILTLSPNIVILWFVFVVYSKKCGVHYRIGQCDRLSARLHDNFRTETLIDLKFFVEFILINISVDFEGGPDPPKISWFWARNIIFFQGLMGTLVITYAGGYDFATKSFWQK